MQRYHGTGVYDLMFEVATKAGEITWGFPLYTSIGVPALYNFYILYLFFLYTALRAGFIIINKRCKNSRHGTLQKQVKQYLIEFSLQGNFISENIILTTLLFANRRNG